MIRLRDGSDADAEALVALQKAASVAAFAHVFPPELYPYPEAPVLEDLRRRLADGTELLVAEDDAAPVGFAAINAGSLEQLYVAPEHWGTGLGARLHDAAVNRRREAGDRELRLWTLEENRRSRRFYERRGWRVDGRTRVVPYPPHPLDVGYSLDLAPR